MNIEKASAGRAVLVAGGAGFLGSFICERLLSEGLKVICVDNLLTGRRSNMARFASHEAFHFVEADIRDVEISEPLAEIWNLASPASPPHYQAAPIETLLINVVGTQRLLELARATGARFFQASTSEIYGDPEQHPQRESYRGAVNPIGVRACYDEGKRAAETLCYDYRRVHGVDVRVARIFNTYGPYMDPKDGRVVSNFIVNALAGEPLELYGDGQQTRSFCYRDDLVEGFFRLVRREEALPGPVNIGNPVEFSVRELAELVIEMTSSQSRMVFKPLPEDDPKLRRPDIALAEQALNWTPKYPLREGLEQTIAYFREIRDASVQQRKAG